MFYRNTGTGRWCRKDPLGRRSLPSLAAARARARPTSSFFFYVRSTYVPVRIWLFLAKDRPIFHCDCRCRCRWRVHFALPFGSCQLAWLAVVWAFDPIRWLRCLDLPLSVCSWATSPTLIIPGGQLSAAVRFTLGVPSSRSI